MINLRSRLAGHLLTLPEGGWAETQQAERQLSDVIGAQSVESALRQAARSARYVHPSRMGWLRQLGRAYSAADEGRVYPALEGRS